MRDICHIFAVCIAKASLVSGGSHGPAKRRSDQAAVSSGVKQRSCLRLRYSGSGLVTWRAGLCVRCRYDLRATPDCCPEFGKPVAKAWSWLQNHVPQDAVLNKWGFKIASGLRITPVTAHDPDVMSAINLCNARCAEAPYAALALVFGSMPVQWLRRRLRKLKAFDRRTCAPGYDLRATPDRCPEYGMPVPRKATA